MRSGAEITGPGMIKPGDLSRVGRGRLEEAHVDEAVRAIERIKAELVSRLSRSSERQQRADVMSIGRFQSRHVSSARFIGSHEIGAAPAKPLLAELHRQQVGCQTSMTPVPVRKRMNEDKPVVEADGDFIRRERLVLHPISHVV